MASKGTLRVRIAGDSGPLKKTLRGATGSIGKFAAGAAAAVGAAAAFSVKAFADFDQAMTNSTAIMGDVSETMRKDMSDAAREVAKTTKFSATEAAESYFFLASAGLDAEASIGALPKVAAFAQAGNFDMALATDLLTDAQSALGLTVEDTTENLENMTRTSDVLVKANTLANSTVQQFSEALTRKAGAAMRSLNMDMEEGVAVLSVFADQGLKGSEAGTTFNAVIRGLTNGVQRNADVWQEHGIAVFDSQGEMRNMADIVGDMEGALGGMSVEQQRATLSQLGFTEETLAGTLALMGNSDAIREYEEQLRGAGGTTDEVADKQLQTFWAQLGLLKDQLIDVGLTIGQAVMPHLLRLMKLLQEHVPTVKAFISDGVGLIKGAFDGAGAASGPFRSALESIWQTIQGLLPPIQHIGQELIAVAGPAFRRIGQLITGQVVPAFADFFSAASPVLNFLIKIVGGALIGAFKGAVTFIEGALETISGILDVFTGVLTGDWAKAWEGVKKIVSGVWKAIKGAFQVFINVGILRLARVGLSLVRGLFSRAWGAIKGLTQSAWNGLKDVLRSAWRRIKDAVRGGVRNVLDLVRGVPGRIVSALGNVGSMLYKAGRGIMQGLIDGLKSMVGKVTGPISDAANKVKSYWPFSPAEAGPLRKDPPETWGRNVMSGIADGMRGNAGQLTSAMSQAAASSASQALRDLGKYQELSDEEWGALRRSGVMQGMGRDDFFDEFAGTPEKRAMLRQTGTGAADGGGRTVIEIRSGGSEVDDLLVEILSRAVSARGGDVQAVIGQGSS